MDTSTLAFLAAPFAASLILTGMHAYLGVHVVERWSDLRRLVARADRLRSARRSRSSCPSPAATRTRRWSTGSASPSPSSGRRCFRRCADTAHGFHRKRSSASVTPSPSAASILAMSKATSESEHLKDMLVGNILAVSWPEVAKTAALYGAIGLFHYIFRAKFLAISMDHSGAVDRGVSVRFWDFPLLRLVRFSSSRLR
jgi:zinc/manganese transport system permease protein